MNWKVGETLVANTVLKTQVVSDLIAVAPRWRAKMESQDGEPRWSAKMESQDGVLTSRRLPWFGRSTRSGCHRPLQLHTCHRSFPPLQSSAAACTMTSGVAARTAAPCWLVPLGTCTGLARPTDSSLHHFSELRCSNGQLRAVANLQCTSSLEHRGRPR